VGLLVWLTGLAPVAATALAEGPHCCCTGEACLLAAKHGDEGCHTSAPDTLRRACPLSGGPSLMVVALTDPSILPRPAAFERLWTGERFLVRLPALQTLQPPRPPTPPPKSASSGS
jgi:hypothetical protein